MLESAVLLRKMPEVPKSQRQRSRANSQCGLRARLDTAPGVRGTESIARSLVQARVVVGVCRQFSGQTEKRSALEFVEGARMAGSASSQLQLGADRGAVICACSADQARDKWIMKLGLHTTRHAVDCCESFLIRFASAEALSRGRGLFLDRRR